MGNIDADIRCFLIVAAIVFSLLALGRNIRVPASYVSVKGIAEQQVTADLAVWNINFKEAGNDLKQTSLAIANDQKLIMDFLTLHGFAADELEIGQTSVNDLFAVDYSVSNHPPQRYIVNASIKVRSDRVDLVRKVSSLISELINKGIVLNKDFGPNPRYLFNKLDTIRPKMLEEATKSARLVAEQFALNSGSKVGRIKRANQGVFQVFSVDGANYSQDDQEGSIHKMVRVVSSIDYYLHAS